MTNLTGDQLIAANIAMNADSLRAFIGPRAEKYVSHWQSATTGARKTYGGWVWPVLFVPVPWLLFRKMYLAAAVVFFLPIIFELLFPGNKIFNVGFVVGVAAVAKDYYLYHAKTKIKKITARYSDPIQQQEKITRAGGVSWPAGIIGGIIMAVQIGFIVLLFLQKAH